MEAHAIRESVHIANRRLDLLLPSWIDNQDVDVIILPKNPIREKEMSHKRVPNLCAFSSDTLIMADDLDAELPDSFWIGEVE